MKHTNDTKGEAVLTGYSFWLFLISSKLLLNIESPLLSFVQFVSFVVVLPRIHFSCV